MSQVIVALIAAVGVAVGAISTFLATYFTNRYKIKEIEILYQQKLYESERAYQEKIDEVYREHAGKYLETLYLPINDSLTKLYAQYDKFRNFLESIRYRRVSPIPDSQRLKSMVEAAEEEYQEACTIYIDQINKLLDQNAYLTSHFENYLRIFNQFLQDSLPLKWYVPDLFITRQGPDLPRRRRRLKNFKRNAKRTSLFSTGKETLDFNLPFEEIMLPAVVISDQYTQRFKYGVSELQAFIKVVTLGVKAQQQAY